MDLLFVTPGLAPYDAAPGAPEVSAALPKALKALDHRVTLVTPIPEDFEVGAAGFSRRLSGLEVQIGDQTETVMVFDGRSMGGCQLVFLEHASFPDLFENGRDGLRAQLIFARAVTRLVELEPNFDLAHVHDEAAALAGVLLSKQARMPVVFTVYEPFALSFSGSDARQLGLDAGGASACPVAMAVAAASYVTTRSPSLAARAIQSDDNPVGQALAARRAQLAGVLNGIDVSVYNPVTDPLLVARFSPHEPWARARNKAMLQRELGLDIDADVPLLGSIESEVGAQRLLEPLKSLLRNDVQVALQVLDEDAECGDALVELSERYPERFQVRFGDSQKRTHALLAGSDALVVTGDDPTLAMAAHRYGAVPVVASDTAAAEHCVDLDAMLQSGDAIVFTPQQDQGLLHGMRRAAAAFNRGLPFDRLRERLMRIDHSYERTARTYDAIYSSLVQEAAAE